MVCYSPSNFSLKLTFVTILPSPVLYLSCCSFCFSASGSNFSLYAYASKPYNFSFSYIVSFFYAVKPLAPFSNVFYLLLTTTSCIIQCNLSVWCAYPFLYFSACKHILSRVIICHGNLQPSICKARFVPELFISAITYFEFRERISSSQGRNWIARGKGFGPLG